MKHLYLLPILFLFSDITEAEIPAISEERVHSLNEDFNTLLKEQNINTIGVSVIKAGEIVWLEHFGMQSPGIPASKKSLFNVGSITKTVSSQTMLELINDQQLKLDEPMSKHWVDPDLYQDVRHNMLTPMMALTHTTGFPNWRFFSPDKKLKFNHKPGTKYGYSGEGFEYLAKYIETKTKAPFEQLVNDYVFKPAGMNNVSFSVNKDHFQNMVQALDETGKFYGHYCRPEGWCLTEGHWSAAGDMVVSVEDYSKFLIWVMQRSRSNGALKKQIENIRINQDIFKGFDCKKIPMQNVQNARALAWVGTSLNLKVVI